VAVSPFPAATIRAELNYLGAPHLASLPAEVGGTRPHEQIHKKPGGGPWFRRADFYDA